jgi:hypothetical protein
MSERPGFVRGALGHLLSSSRGAAVPLGDAGLRVVPSVLENYGPVAAARVTVEV